MRNALALAAAIALAGCEGSEQGGGAAPPPPIAATAPPIAAPAPPIAATAPPIAAPAPPATPLVAAPPVETAAPGGEPKAVEGKPGKRLALPEASARDLANALADTNVNGSKDGLLADVKSTKDRGNAE